MLDDATLAKLIDAARALGENFIARSRSCHVRCAASWFATLGCSHLLQVYNSTTKYNQHTATHSSGRAKGGGSADSMSAVGRTGMEPLVEVNNEAEMERALAVGSKAIHPSNTVKLSGRTASNRIQEPIYYYDYSIGRL